MNTSGSLKLKQWLSDIEKLQSMRSINKTQSLKLEELENKIKELSKSQISKKQLSISDQTRNLRRSTRFGAQVTNTPKSKEVEGAKPIKKPKENDGLRRKNQSNEKICDSNNSKIPRKLEKEDFPVKRAKLSIDTTIKEFEAPGNVEEITPNDSGNSNSNPGTLSPSLGIIEKFCAFCLTKSTPIWRSGPQKLNLCNSCGVSWKRHKSIQQPKSQAKLSIGTDAPLTSLLNFYPSPIYPDFQGNPFAPPVQADKQSSSMEKVDSVRAQNPPDKNDDVSADILPKFFSFTGTQNTCFFPNPSELSEPSDRKLYLAEKILDMDPYKLAQVLLLVPPKLKEAFENALRFKRGFDIDLHDIDDETWGLLSGVLGQ
jgi:hypothetical protein